MKKRAGAEILEPGNALRRSKIIEGHVDAVGYGFDEVFCTTKNALLVPCILEMVFPSLPLTDLRNCRRVCATWNQEINRFMRKVKCMKVTQNKFDDAFAVLRSGKGKPASYLSQLSCKECSTSNAGFEKLIIYKGRFLHKLVLDKCQVDINSFRNLILVDSFPYLALLTMKQVVYVDSSAGRQTIFLPEQAEDNDDDRPMLEYLKSLEIEERGSASQTTLKNIAVMCPNLQRLSFSNCPVPSLLEFKSKRCKSANFSNLEFLQLAPIHGRKMDHPFFEVLMKLRLKNLKALVLYGMNPGGKKRMKCLQSFLKSVSPTLESLHLAQRIMYNPEYQPNVPSPFPVLMPTLRKMSVGPGFIHSLKFLEKIPHLTSFTCSRVSSEDWVKVTKNGLPNPLSNLASMDLGDIGHVSLKIMGPVFPNLSRLELNVCRIHDHDEILRAICANFPQLKMFNIYDVANQNRLTDAGVIGLTTKECSKLASLKNKKFEPTRSHPYIGDLKCLVDLRLQYLSGKLTDLSVLHGIKDIPTLFALDLSKSQITNKSLEVLGETATHLSVLYVRDCQKITPQGISKFRKLRPNIQLRT